MEILYLFLLNSLITTLILINPSPSSSQLIQKEFKLALVQMYVEPGMLEINLSHAEDLIREAAENKADVVLLPEVMDLGWAHPSARILADKIPDGETCKRLCKSAKNKRQWQQQVSI